jgi:hypothetical protein
MSDPDDAVGPRRSIATWAALSVTVAVMAMIVALERRFPLRYDSDDVAWQIALRSWRPGHDTLVLTENTYVLHVPALVLGDLLPAGPAALLAVSWVLNVVGLAMIVWVAEHVVATALDTTRDRLGWRLRAAVVAAIVVVVLISPTQRWIMSGLTSRNLEIGIGLIIIWRLTTIWSAREAPSVGRAVGGAVVLALVGLDDPLLMYSIVVPAVVVALGAIAVGRRDAAATPRPAAAWIAIVGLGGLAGWRLLRWVVGALGVRQAGAGNELVTPRRAFGHLDELVEVLGRITTADMIDDGVWYRTVAGVLAVAVPVAAVVVLIRARPVPLTVWTILGWPVVLSLLYVATSAGSNPDTLRYVAVGYPAVGVAVAVAAARSPVLRTVVLAFAVVATVVATATLLDRRGNEGNGTYQLALQLREAGDEAGATIGYSGYWTAHIVTYYAGDPPTVLATICDADGRTAPFEWLTDLGRFERDEPAASSFVIVDTSPSATACPPDLIIAQHGTPSEIVGVDGDTQIWIYDGDVTTVVE